MRNLLPIFYLIFLLPSCVCYYQESAYLPPTNIDKTPITEEIRDLAKLALKKADAPAMARVESVNVIDLENKNRYQLRIETVDGSIWRAAVEKPTNPDLPASVVSVNQAVAVHGIFKPYASAVPASE